MIRCSSCQKEIAKSALRRTSEQLYDAVICETCSHIECTQCKQACGQIDSPCPKCGKGVSPAYEKIVIRVNDMLTTNANGTPIIRCDICGTEPVYESSGLPLEAAYREQQKAKYGGEYVCVDCKTKSSSLGSRIARFLRGLASQ